MKYLETDKFKARVQELLEKHHAPGLALAVTTKGEIQTACFGQASIDPPKPCSADTLFDIASCSKSFTAASIGLLVADNDAHPEVQYDAIVSKLLPGDFVLSEDSYTRQVTVDDIMSHRTGLGRHDFSFMGPKAAEPDDVKSITRSLRHLSITAPIRTKEIYNNLMYSVAAYLVEVKSQKTFSNFLSERLFQPLGMNSSYLGADAAREGGDGDRIATGYSWPEGKNEYLSVPCRTIPEAVGNGNIVTSVEDGIKWIHAMMNQRGPITKDVYEGVMRSRIIVDNDEAKLPPFDSPPLYASGWGSSYYRGYRVVVHTGGEAGFSSRHFFLPRLKFGGVMYGNSEGVGSVIYVLMSELIDELLDVPQTERPDWEKIEAEDDDEEEIDDDAGSKSLKAMRQMYPDITEPGKLEMALDAYVGVYSHPGYHQLEIVVKDDLLYIDASTRGMAFTMTLEHAADQTRFIGWMTDSLTQDRRSYQAEFVFEGPTATRFGIHLEDSTEELIWFDRIKPDESR